jgi:hypothetical protein
MVLKVSLILVLLIVLHFFTLEAISKNHNHNVEPKKSLTDFAVRDLTRIQTLHKRVIEKKNQNFISRLQNTKEESNKSYKPSVVAPAAPPEYFTRNYSSQLVATLESGVSFGSGEYFIDVFIGTPSKHFSLILDTGSDLNWIQCVPCYVCFDQIGPYYDPKDSSSFNNISCHDPRCQFVTSPDPPQPSCKPEKAGENQTFVRIFIAMVIAHTRPAILHLKHSR